MTFAAEIRLTAALAEVRRQLRKALDAAFPNARRVADLERRARDLRMALAR